MSNNKELYSPVYGCTIFDDKYEDDDRKVTDYEVLLSLSKSLKTQQLKLLHKRAILSYSRLFLKQKLNYAIYIFGG